MKKASTSTLFSCFFGIALVMSACSTGPSEPAFEPEVLPLTDQLARYEAMEIPDDNPMTPEKVALGRQLFFDSRLSGDGSRSCYSCHLCENGLSTPDATPTAAFGKPLPRNSPVLWNIGYHSEFYWDGRSNSLEKQAQAAWTGANMGARDRLDEIVAEVNASPGYRSQFESAFGGEATPDNISAALAAFERTIISGDTAWDRFQAGDQTALSESALRGWDIFNEKAKCTDCHAGALLTDLQYHNVGIGTDRDEPDVGRFKVTGQDKDTGAFKTPTLRNVAASAPYFHNGSVATLEEAVDLMLGGGIQNPYLDPTLQKRDLTEQERSDLLAFLRSLTTECSPLLTKPPIPGEEASQ